MRPRRRFNGILYWPHLWVRMDAEYLPYAIKWKPTQMRGALISAVMDVERLRSSLRGVLEELELAANGQPFDASVIGPALQILNDPDGPKASKVE